MIDFATKPTIEGERVILRPVSEDDVAGLMDLLHDPVSASLTGTHTEFDEATARRWYATRGEQTDRLDHAIEERATGAYAGEVVLNDLDRDNRCCGFRIGLRPGFTDRGLGGEATRLILDYAFGVAGLHRVELEVYAHNPRARHVYERCGFVLEGTRRDALRWDGAWIDAHTMAVLSTDPRSRSAR